MPLLLLAACNSHRADPGAVSPEEDRMLNEAAASQEAPNAATSAPAANATAPAD
ncbi:MAG: hypothetical protein J0I47_01155 [Sphingomonas sp.]|uniref:hypothetical protein n=1 Tax=Sphingomonas sp. TaxID=28214 RepID=UPI001AC5C72C|nr:hypothetical protein [Sphingomonas sp.]MBN8806836.1 hypothetical protein [Sphingomonas sp.]